MPGRRSFRTKLTASVLKPDQNTQNGYSLFVCLFGLNVLRDHERSIEEGVGWGGGPGGGEGGRRYQWIAGPTCSDPQKQERPTVSHHQTKRCCSSGKQLVYSATCSLNWIAVRNTVTKTETRAPTVETGSKRLSNSPWEPSSTSRFTPLLGCA